MIKRNVWMKRVVAWIVRADDPKTGKGRWGIDSAKFRCEAN